MTFKPDPILTKEHLQWFSKFNVQHKRNWRKLYKDDPEAAMCEAAVRRLLEQNGNSVEPNEDLTGSNRSPDFRCFQSGKTFFTEVTCISIEKATKETDLPHLLTHGGEESIHGQLNKSFFNASKKKTTQCANIPHPTLIAVGTFHFQASAICFGEPYIEMLLTGETFISCDIDMCREKAVGVPYEGTRLKSAMFLCPDKVKKMNHARNPISGIILCGFGCNPPEIHGVLHPSPNQVFDRSLLPNIKFCSLQKGYESGIMNIEWI